MVETRSHRWSLFLGGIIFIISIVGMVIFKSKSEIEPSSLNDLYFNLFRGLLLLMAIYLVVEWSLRKLREYRYLKEDKMNAELLHLKNQISPHFFFNTLNTLYGMIKKDPDGAQNFVLKLSDLMRYSIYRTDKGMVTIEQEIEYLQNFIDLNKIRYHKNITIQFDIAIDQKSYPIHPLLLIVLLENAFKHGVEKLTEKAHIGIELKVSDGHLIFTVENDYESQDNADNAGLGLENLSKRLKLLYPDRHKLQIKQNDHVFKTQLELFQ